MVFQTEFEFTLPKGYVDEEGNIHREGVMRLATAADEITIVKDPSVQENPAYLTVVLLSRVITELGSLPEVTPKTIEGLFASDLAYLEDFYRKVNGYVAEPPVHQASDSAVSKADVDKGLKSRRIFWVILLLLIAAIVLALYLSPNVERVIEDYTLSFPG